VIKDGKKYCFKCKQDKFIEEFNKDKSRKDGYSNKCRSCAKYYNNIYYENNKEEIKFKNREYEHSHKEERNEYRRLYKQTEKGRDVYEAGQIKYRNSEKYRKTRKKYWNSNKYKEKRKKIYRKRVESGKEKEYYLSDKGKEVLKRKYINRIQSGKKAKYERERRKNDPNYKLARNLRNRVWSMMKNISKSDSTLNLLGCTIDEFKKYIENLFTEGMTWENYGKGKNKWNLDHYVPCSYFDLTDPEQQKICFHYFNIQPLWSCLNSSKNGVVPDDVLEYIDFIKNYINRNAI
jgi:hypothetical protein